MKPRKLKRQYSLGIFALCLCLFPLIGVSAPIWQSLDSAPEGTPPTVEVTSWTTNTTTIQVTIHGFWEDEVTTDTPLGPNTVFKVIQLPEFANSDPDYELGMYQGTNQIGKSQLPMVRKMLGIITEATTATVTHIEYTAPVTFSPGYRIYPYQGQVCPGESQGFAFDTTHYLSTQSYPYDAGSPPYSDMRHNVGDWHAARVATIPIAQFSASPGSEEMTVYHQAEATIEHSGTPLLAPYCISLVWEPIVSSLVINWSHLPFVPVRRTKRLRIYVADSYASNAKLTDFIKWKKRQGFTVDTKKVPTDVANNFTSIYNDIKNFNNAHPCNNIYILFVGDVDKIKTGSHTHLAVPKYGDKVTDSDYVYTLMGNDNYPDLFLGRISVDNNTDVTNIFTKIIKYEKNPPTGNWVEKVLLAAHRDGGKFVTYKNRVKNNPYSKKTPTFSTRYGTQSNGTVAGVKSDINEGRGIVNYNGHGGKTVWSSWDYNSASLTTTDVGALTNGDSTPVIFAMCCWNGNISHEDCLGEEWLETPSKGAVAHVGFCDTEWITASCQYDERLFKKILDKGIYGMGPAMNAAQVDTLKDYEDLITNSVKWNYNYGKYNAYVNLLLGDPTMLVRTEATKDFDEVIGDNPIDGYLTYTVTVKDNGQPVEDATVCIEYTDGGPIIRHVGITNSSGQVSFSGISVFGPIYVTAIVSKHNYTTWEGCPGPPALVENWFLY